MKIFGVKKFFNCLENTLIKLQTTIGQRFMLFLKRKKMQQKDYCQLTGYSERTLSNIVNGNTKNPKADFFESILVHFPYLNIRWIILGEEPMLFDDSIEDEVKLMEEKTNLLIKENRDRTTDLVNEYESLNSELKEKSNELSLLIKNAKVSNETYKKMLKEMKGKIGKLNEVEQHYGRMKENETKIMELINKKIEEGVLDEKGFNKKKNT